MISFLKIERFKSIKELEISCRRVNVFIGPPNSGKSNILEVLGMLSFCGHESHSLTDFIRFNHPQYLFYDGILDQPVEIGVDKSSYLKIFYERDYFHVYKTGVDILSQDKKGNEIFSIYSNGTLSRSRVSKDFERIKFYRFKPASEYKEPTPGSLKPPFGINLFHVIYGSKNLREFAAQLFKPFGLKFVFKLHEKEFELQKEIGDVVVGIPFSQVSDTLQRILFYYTAIKSNKNSTMVFEEPESNAFPYYIKLLSEIIAHDEENQYFISTHNPYMLSAIIEKTKKDNLAVFATYYEDYQTKVKHLNEGEIKRMFEAEPFFELEDLFGTK